MKNNVMASRKCLTFMVAILFFCIPAFSQVVHFGVKGGSQMSWVRSDDPNFRKTVKILPVFGYNAGAVVSFKVKERYFLHTEYLFSTKGKFTKSRNNPVTEDRATYQYIEFPILYNIHFKGSLGSTRKFKWYAGAGPLFSYWLGGKGSINSDEFAENGFPPFDYKIRFGERGEDISEYKVIFVKDVNRLQLGFNIGGGILIEPANSSKIMVDLRFELGHTWMGTATSADYVIPVTYDDNLKTRNMGLRLSVMYLMETNLNKKIRNKGKSNLKSKGQMIKKKK